MSSPLVTLGLGTNFSSDLCLLLSRWNSQADNQTHPKGLVGCSDLSLVVVLLNVRRVPGRHLWDKITILKITTLD